MVIKFVAGMHCKKWRQRCGEENENAKRANDLEQEAKRASVECGNCLPLLFPGIVSDIQVGGGVVIAVWRFGWTFWR